MADSVESRELLAMLRQLLVVLSLQDGWTRGAIARNSRGDAVHPLDPSAVKWCFSGVCGLVAWRDPDRDRADLRYEALCGYLMQVEPSLFARTMARYNDEEGKEAVLGIIRRAIAIQTELRSGFGG